MTPSITQQNINIALGNFLANVLGLPNGQVVVGQVNRVPEPEADFCVMWPISRKRLATNVDTTADAKFTASISGNILAVTNISIGSIEIGNTIFGIGIADNTIITQQTHGDEGGIGAYLVSVAQNVSNTMMSAGATEVATSTELVMQVDVHGPNSTDNAQTIQQLFRDQYGVTQFEGTGISPLYVDDPRQSPFIDAAAQYEDRWIVDMHLQITPTIAVPQEYADSLVVNPVNIDTIYDSDLESDLTNSSNVIVVPTTLTGV